MKEKKDGSTSSEAQQWARELESLGRDVLAQCEDCPEFLHWSPQFSDVSSLCTLATQLIHEVEWWVLVQIGERRLIEDQDSHYPFQSTLADLRACYEEWIREVHTLLDPLPDAFLDLYVGSRFGASTSKIKTEVPTVRTCLFRAMERCAVLLGRIEIIHQLMPDHAPPPQELQAQVK
jgi:hypothetical protein